ncbi:MAG: hypothetical protein JW798_03980 [Prolixibacteraceae bacterium]|nr:hypothetical protein [Prolixibacteraceae bacterium]
MKKLITLSILLIIAFSVKAVEPIFVKGDKVINLGISADWYTTVSASGEMCIADGIIEKGSIGVGAFAGYGIAISSYYSNSSRILVGARGAFHYPFIDKLDTYAGLALGARYSIYTYSSNYFGLSYGGFVGARYYFSEKLAAFAEAGYGLGYLTVGVAFKL